MKLAVPKDIRIAAFRLRHPLWPRYTCPICGYHGPFRQKSATTGNRRHSRCPKCDSLERHRHQALVIDELFGTVALQRLSMLHVAPESFFRSRFSRAFGRYVCVDLSRRDVDCRCDLRLLPFHDNQFHFVYASHVLEHIQDDRSALLEIKRVLRPGGAAILPVPICGEVTVEYSEPNPRESMHYRAPGKDYFERLKTIFSRVDIKSSESFGTSHQLLLYHEGASPAPDYVPICYV